MHGMQPKLTYLALAWLIGGLIGCDDGTPATVPAPTSTPETWSHLHFSQPSGRHEAEGWNVEAWFAQFSGADAAVIRDAMDVIDTPPPGCTLIPSRLSTYSLESLRFRAIGSAEVLDDQAQRTLLHPKTLSLRTNDISGVVYRNTIDEGSSSSLSTVIRDQNDHIIADIGMETPSGLGFVEWNEGSLDGQSSLAISLDEPLTLKIDAAADASFVSVRRMNEHHSSRLLCRLEGDTLVLQPEQFESLGEHASHLLVQLVLRNERLLTQKDNVEGAVSIDLLDRLAIERLP